MKQREESGMIPNGRIELPFIEMRNSTRGIGLGGCGENVGLGIQF